MKANKALKRLSKIEALISDVTERYSASAPRMREMLQNAKTAVAQAKEAVSLRASSGTAKNLPVKRSKPPSKATPEPGKPKRKLTAAGRSATVKAPTAKTGKKSTPLKKAAVKTTTATKKAPVPAQAATAPAAQRSGPPTGSGSR